MDSFEKIERKRQARHRIRAQRERAGRLKTRVIATSLICFALLWGIVFAQMATGNDPVLGSSKPEGRNGGGNGRVAKAPAEPTGAGSAEPAAREPEEREEEEFAAELAAEETEAEPVEEEPAPVTTSQS